MCSLSWQMIRRYIPSTFYSLAFNLDFALQVSWLELRPSRLHWHVDKFASCEHTKRGMHVISRKALKKAGEIHADAVAPLDVWYRIAVKATWKTLVELQGTLPTADFVAPHIIFNIKGNAYRLITQIFFNDQTILIRGFYTHAEYAKGGWK